ncbi:hypothetical protein ACNKHR_16045 [Shigella flexneri]
MRAPGITPEPRRYIGAALLQSVRRYRLSRPVLFEFLFENREFYFIEMNTLISRSNTGNRNNHRH